MTKLIRCPWVKCAHGMAVAHTGSCYAGEPKDANCPEFITDEEYEKWMKEKEKKRND